MGRLINAAVVKGDIATVRRLLSEGGDVNERASVRSALACRPRSHFLTVRAPLWAAPLQAARG